MGRKRPSIVLAMLVMVLTFFTGSFRAAWAQEATRIAISELKGKLDSGAEFLLIDVREDHELERDGAIAGAVHIPMGELDDRMKDIPKDIDLVFY